MIMKYPISLIFILLIFTASALAVPSLQLYMPDATYYDVNPWFPSTGESWITTSNPFELQVVGATTPSWVHLIDNIYLHIALLKDEYELYKSSGNPFITISDIDPNINFEAVLYAGDFSSYGKPDGIAPHGIYPTYYTSIKLPDLLVGSAGETVYDYNKDFDPANPGASGCDIGDIQYYRISYDPRFTFIHFDLTGIAHNGNSKNVFAPYSHDADAVIPEPGTLILIGSGLIGIAGYSKFRLTCRKKVSKTKRAV